MNSVLNRIYSTRNILVYSKSLLSHKQSRCDVKVYVNTLFAVKFHSSPDVKTDPSSREKDISHDGNPYILKPVSKSSSTALKIKKISKAMKAYLERAKDHNIFLTAKNDEFEIGKHHLANMMGIEADTMTQEDINKAIEYLLPSGLYQIKARPVMKPPEELFPREKAAQFDDSGRPFSSFFYTRKPNFYQTMHEIVTKFNELDEFEDKMLRKGIAEPPAEYKLDLSGGQWFTVDEFKQLFIEEIIDIDYNFIINTLTRLGEHPYAFRCKDFIWLFRKDFVDVSALETLPELMYDENGRPYMQAKGTMRTAQAEVTVRGNGSGKIDINGMDISYFYRLEDRQMIMFPLELTGLLNKVDLEAKVWSGGVKIQAGAIRYAMSMCLRCFVTDEVRERMRFAGLLTWDRRRKERNRPGRTGPRAKPRWQKR